MSVAVEVKQRLSVLIDFAVMSIIIVIFLWLYEENILLLPGYLVLALANLIKNTVLSPITFAGTVWEVYLLLFVIGLSIFLGYLSHRTRTNR